MFKGSKNEQGYKAQAIQLHMSSSHNLPDMLMMSALLLADCLPRHEPAGDANHAVHARLLSVKPLDCTMLLLRDAAATTATTSQKSQGPTVPACSWSDVMLSDSVNIKMPETRL